jgi:hypothetical protein
LPDTDHDTVANCPTRPWAANDYPHRPGRTRVANRQAAAIFTNADRHLHADGDGYPHANSDLNSDGHALRHINTAAHGHTASHGTRALSHARGVVTGAFLFWGRSALD